MDKDSLFEAEKFAKKIIRIAAEEGLTVNQLCKASDIAKAISINSAVEWEAVGKTDFASN